MAPMRSAVSSTSSPARRNAQKCVFERHSAALEQTSSKASLRTRRTVGPSNSALPATSRPASFPIAIIETYRWLRGHRWTRRSEPGVITLATNDRPFGAEQFYGDYNSWERTRTWFASARQSLGEKTDAAFAFRRHTDLFVLYRDRPLVFTNRHAVEGYQVSARRRENLGQNIKLYYGAELYRDSIDSNNLGVA